MVAGVSFSGNWKEIPENLKYLGKMAPKIIRTEYGRLIRDTADVYVQSFNHFMNVEHHRSLAKARRTKLSSGGKNYDKVQVKVPKTAVSFDLGQNNKPIQAIKIKTQKLRLWTIKHWKQTRINGYNRWHTGFKRSGMSQVYGRRNQPKGTMVVQSHQYTFGWSILERSKEIADDYFMNKLFGTKRKAAERLMKENRMKREYYLRINMNL